jgi:hypothetical protein
MMRAHLSAQPSEWSHTQTTVDISEAIHFIVRASLGQFRRSTGESGAKFFAET